MRNTLSTSRHIEAYGLKFVIYLTLALLLPGVVMSQDNLLFTPLERNLNAEETAIIEHLESKATILRARQVSLNSKALTGGMIAVQCFDAPQVEIQRQRLAASGIDLPSWTGSFKARMGSAAFVVNGERISGHINSIDGNFEILPIGEDGEHILIEHDATKFEGCGDPHTTQAQPDHEEYDYPKGKPLRLPGDNECFIRVIVAYTSKAQDSTMAVYGRTMREHVSLAVLETNQGYANSQIDQRIELAYLYQTDDPETENSLDDVTSLRDTVDGKWDELHMYRDLYQADMTCLVSGGTYEGICGRAFGFNYTEAEDMFQVTEFDCIVGNYTFAHEFGHLQGCRHDIDVNTTPYAYGHGYNQGTLFRTIMAVCCNPVRVNYWSNPWIYYPDGGPMGTFNFSNSAMALNESGSISSHHRLTPMEAFSGDQIGDDELAFTRSIEVIESADTAQVGSQILLNTTDRIRLAPGFRALYGSAVRINTQDTGCPMDE